MPAIITPGTLLPNGMFLPNSGDGHAKNAWRFCEKYEKLDLQKNKSVLNADEFLITAGCGIVATYSGKRCFKVAVDNPNELINQKVEAYREDGAEIWPYWKIDVEAITTLNEILNSMQTMQLQIVKG